MISNLKNIFGWRSYISVYVSSCINCNVSISHTPIVVLKKLVKALRPDKVNKVSTFPPLSFFCSLMLMTLTYDNLNINNNYKFSKSFIEQNLMNHNSPPIRMTEALIASVTA